MKKAELEEFHQLFRQVVKLFRSRCWICNGKYNQKEAFVIHHRDYNKTEKIYSDFKTTDGKLDKLSYYRYLIPIVKQNPKRFRLLHHKHHWLAESWARFKLENFERCVKVAREIIKRREGKL